ncbi:MAG: DUF1285 domain-containing protein [Asticcacaulis sp.]
MTALWAEAARFPDKTYPVESWKPALCGEMNLVIARDGVWWHDGRPIVRPELVRLFSILLRYEDGDYYLVTPVEKLRITVEDLPFRIVDRDGLTFITDQGTRLTIGDEHPLCIDIVAEEWLPRLRVKGDLWARFTRSEAYRLFETAEMDGAGQVVHLTLEGQGFDIPIEHA